MRKINRINIALVLVLFLLFGAVLFGVGFVFDNPTHINKILARNLYASAHEDFPDQNFYSCVVDSYNSKNRTEIAYTETLTDEQLSTITHLECRGYAKDDSEKITSVDGIEKLINVTYVALSGNNISNISFSNNKKIYMLDVADNNLSSIDISQNTELESFYASSNELAEVNITNNNKLKILVLAHNQLTNIDLSKNICLTDLNLNYNQLTDIDLSNNLSLSELYLSNNQLTDIDLSKNVVLESLNLGYNELVNIVLSNNTTLKSLNIERNKLINIDLSNNINLTSLNLSSNQLNSVDLSKNILLISLYASENPLTYLNLSENKNLTDLRLGTLRYGDVYLYRNEELQLFVPNNVVFNDSVNVSLTRIETLDALTVNGDKVSSSELGNYLIVGNYDHAIGNHGSYRVSFNINVIEITSNKYIIDEENNYILVFDSMEEDIKENITVPDGVNLNVDLTQDKLEVLAGEEVLKEFKILTFTSDTYKLKNNNILIEEAIDLVEFTENLSLKNVTFKVYRDEQEITSGNVQDGDIVKVVSDDYGELVSYTIREQYLNFGTLSLDEENHVIKSIKAGTKVNEIKNLISTSGDVSVLDTKGVELDNNDLITTGSIVKIVMTSDTYEYRVSVLGDVVGDGLIDIADVGRLYKHLIHNKETDIISDIWVLYAGDVVAGDDIIISDVGKLYKYVRGTIDEI